MMSSQNTAATSFTYSLPADLDDRLDALDTAAVLARLLFPEDEAKPSVPGVLVTLVLDLISALISASTSSCDRSDASCSD